MEILKRTSNSINLASYWENVQLKKYNFDPAYQRKSDVWNEEKKSFLIDTILKNFPMPPIFLHQHIEDKSGKTIYDIIDGKQRLTTIIDFIENKIPLPDDFSSDGRGEPSLNGIYFKDLEDDVFIEWKRIFWRYELSIEYVDTDQTDVINNLFDRLNRNGEPLTPQELRKAKYNQTALYRLILDLSGTPFWQTILDRLERNRLEDHEFISELLFVILEGQIFASDNVKIVDGLYETYSGGEKSSNFALHEIDIRRQFNEITELVESFHLNLKEYKIEGVSHMYGLWVLAWVITIKGYDSSNLSVKLNEFYHRLITKDMDSSLTEYKNSMSSATKSRTQRVRRANALLHYCGLPELP